MFFARQLGRTNKFSDLDLNSASGPQPKRVRAADTAKGIAILFVVFGHAWRGVFGAGLLQNEALFAWIDALIYAWHMPFFFFLSGLYFLPGLQKQPPGPFVLRRVTRLLWPMALWTWIFFGFKMLAGSAANTPVSPTDFPIIPLPPFEHLWFLWALFLVQLVVMVLALVGQPMLGSTDLRRAFVVVAVGLAAALSVLHIPSEIFGLAVLHMPYFLAGAVVGRLSEVRPSVWATSGAALGAVVLFAAVLYGLPTVPLSLGLVLFLWVIVAFLDKGNARAPRLISALRYLGQASMAIYLTHTIFSAALRFWLSGMDINAVLLHLVLATTVGVLCPLGVLWSARRLGITRFLGL